MYITYVKVFIVVEGDSWDSIRMKIPVGRLLNVEQAADALAVREKTVHAWIAQRRLGYVRVGGRAIASHKAKSKGC
jgi:excisionase family DNA binding protein